MNNPTVNQVNAALAFVAEQDSENFSLNAYRQTSARLHDVADNIGSPSELASVILAAEVCRLRTVLEQIAGETPGVFPDKTGPGLAIAHERAAAKALEK